MALEVSFLSLNTQSVSSPHHQISLLIIIQLHPTAFWPRVGCRVSENRGGQEGLSRDWENGKTWKLTGLLVVISFIKGSSHTEDGQPTKRAEILMPISFAVWGAAYIFSCIYRPIPYAGLSIFILLPQGNFFMHIEFNLKQKYMKGSQIYTCRMREDNLARDVLKWSRISWNWSGESVT